MHAEHLEAFKGVGPHTISVPRIRNADDVDASSFSNAIDDETFAKIVAVIRIAVPYTGMIISTRESKASREKVLELGVSQLSGGSKTSVGGYADSEINIDAEDENTKQFDISDNRTLDQIINWLVSMDYIPSFCTACYREGRTGDRFMTLAKDGQISNCCQPNALMTLKEYLMDYASSDTRIKGERLIAKEILNVPNLKIRTIAEKSREHRLRSKRLQVLRRDYGITGYTSFTAFNNRVFRKNQQRKVFHSEHAHRTGNISCISCCRDNN